MKRLLVLSLMTASTHAYALGAIHHISVEDGGEEKIRTTSPGSFKKNQIALSYALQKETTKGLDRVRSGPEMGPWKLKKVGVGLGANVEFSVGPLGLEVATRQRFIFVRSDK